MKRTPRPATLKALTSLLAILLVASAGTVEAANTQPVAGYIVVYRDSVGENQVGAETNRLAGAHNFASEFRYSHALKGFAAKLTAQQVNALRGDPSVAFVSADRPVHAVAPVPLITGELAPTGVRRIGAATTTTAREASVASVAIIDTGIDLTHPDLNAVNGTNCIRTSSTAQDDNGHGTHVAGTVGAKNQGAGVVGVAPGTRLFAVKVLDRNGSGSWASVICGIDWVTANAVSLNIKVASMSLGGSGSNDNNCGNTNSDALHKAICNSSTAGVTYVVAAGNSAADFATFVPAAYPEALTVTAMSDSDGLPGGTGGAPTCRTGELDDSYASFSNFATATIEINHTIAGPGVCIYSTWLSGGYNTISGTSMATPHVTGSVALCLGEGVTPGPCAGLTPAQIVQKLRSDAATYATANPTAGFVGDPNHPVSAGYFGHLVWDGATTATPDFTLSASPTSQTVTQGSPVSYTVTITPSGGFTGSVNLSVSGLPTGAGGTFSPNPATSSSTLSVTTSSTTPTGTYPLTITGASGSLTRTTSATLVVSAPATPDFTLSASPTSRSVRSGKSTSYTITITPSGGFTGSVNLSVSGLPTGAGGTFSPNPATSSSTLSVTTSSTNVTGTYLLTITGTSGSLTRTTNVTLIVR